MTRNPDDTFTLARWPASLARRAVAERVDEFVDQWRRIAADSVSACYRLDALPPSAEHQALSEAFQWSKRVALNAVNLGLAAADCFATPSPANRLALARYDEEPTTSDLLTLAGEDLEAAIGKRLDCYDSLAGRDILPNFADLKAKLDELAG